MNGGHMLSTAELRLGLGGPRIGEIDLDPTAIRGEGGWYDPRLVVPLKITMQQQPEDHQIALVQVTASLHLDQNPSPANRIGTEAMLDLFREFRCRSVHTGPSNTQLQLR